MRALALVLLAGCMTDPNGDTCFAPPQGTEGYCPDDSGGGGSRTRYHSYYGGDARVLSDHTRLAMSSREDLDDPMIETTTLRAGAAAPPVEPVTLNGEPLVGEWPLLSTVGDQVVMLWAGTRGGSRNRAGLLRSDGSIDPGTPLTLVSHAKTIRRVGNRHLVVHSVAMGVAAATWLTADGGDDGSLELATNVGDVIGETGDGESYGFVTRDAMHTELRITRLGASPIVIRASGKQVFGDIASIALLPTGDVLAFYELYDYGVPRELHAVHASGSTFTDRVVTELPTLPKLVVHGDRILALTVVTVSTGNYFEARTIDIEARPTSLPVYAGNQTSTSHAIATPDGFAVINEFEHVSITPLNLDGSVTSETIVASSYVIDEGGCSATRSSPSLLLVLVALPLARRRRSLQRNAEPAADRTTAGLAV